MLKGKESEPSKLFCVLSFPENLFLSVSDLDYKIPGAAIVFNLNLLQYWPNHQCLMSK